MNTDLPYIVEYSKSSRASCKVCKKGIEKEILRIGIMVQSPKFDGKIPTWHHAKCFLEKKKAAASAKIEEIANFDNIKWDDQKMIKDGLAEAAKGPKGKGKKGKSADCDSDFSIEYAKSSRASCKLCGDKLSKGEIRISKIITDTPEAHRFGPMPGWHHVDCFVKVRLELGFTDSANTLPGFKSLSEEDQKMILEKLEKLGVKRKAETKSEGPPPKLAKEDKIQKTMKAQNDLLFNMRDLIKKNLSKKEMITLLEYNNQHVSIGEQHIRDNLSDFLVFGAIKPCPECKNSRPRFKLDAYRCSGNLTEWTKCMFVTKCPEREPFKIPEDMKEEYDFLREYKYVKRNRLFPSQEEAASAVKGPLDGCLIMLHGKFQISKGAMEKRVTELGGLVSTKITNSLTCCITTEDEVSKPGKIKKASELGIHVVSPKFLEDIKSGSSVAIAIKENMICDWGGDPILKFGIKQENKLKIKEKSKSSYVNPYKSSTMKISVKGGAAVDPDSGMQDNCHVYQKGDTIYNCVLGVVDVARDRNTFYKLQILEPNKNKKRYYVFRAWGRVGTTIGGNKLEDFENVNEAIALYEFLYLERTGNEWKNRKNFVKKPGALYPLDIDYGQEFEDIKELKPGDNSKLAKPIQELICLIFDIEAMKKAMLEFEIDLKKMPLGKLSKKQIEKAYSVLSEAQQILVTGSNATKILDASNRFYTLIPHDFGLKQPTLLDNEELIKAKIEMLDSLLEIEFAYKLLKSDGEGHTSAIDPVDEHYEKLNTDIEVLEEASNEFDVIKTYLKNTHASTHTNYDLKLKTVFKINRHGESERYQKFKDLHNKKLLWHGSRLTNFVGILSQGLRIAPPEAPATGYMFGKGIYFADMVSKSANYCYTNKRNSNGLLLLCEVALGNMWEKTDADMCLNLPSDKHSVKGCGGTIPNPKKKKLYW